MAKVKIVQIAFMGEDGATEYIDDKGRVWYDNGKLVDDPEHPNYRKWVNNWKQLDLPEEPED